MVAIGLIAMLVVSPLRGQRSSRNPLSPHETATSVVDGAKITITYGRPSMRGRKIFGSLVPYDRVWMPGADAATIFQTSAPLQFGDFKLPAGSYSLYTLPSEKRWTLIINKKTGEWGIPYKYESDELARIDMKVSKLPSPVENFTISYAKSGAGCTLQIDWEATRASVDITAK